MGQEEHDDGLDRKRNNTLVIAAMEEAKLTKKDDRGEECAVEEDNLTNSRPGKMAKAVGLDRMQIL